MIYPIRCGLQLLSHQISYSTNNIVISPSIIQAKEWLNKLTTKNIPSKVFTFRFDRASGPGGQNVNKVNSKCTLTLNDFSQCDWVPHEVKQQLKNKPFRYYMKSSDSLVIQSDETRMRESNRRLCIDKFIKEVKLGCEFPNETDKVTIRKWDMFKSKDNEHRIRQKKFNSDRKKLRTKSIDF